MADIICPLYDQPDHRPLLDTLRSQEILIRTARSWDRTPLDLFVETRFSRRWADEVLRAFHRDPNTAIIAVRDEKIVGFAAFEVTAPGYFGPTGVEEALRGQGIGKALLYESLAGLRNLGYAYGIIGWPGPIEFYLKATGGLVLPEHWSNIYTGAAGVTC